MPRNIGETLARMNGMAVFDCPFAVERFDVKQHWHARYHEDAANRWLRGVVASLFMRGAAAPDHFRIDAQSESPSGQ